MRADPLLDLSGHARRLAAFTLLLVWTLDSGCTVLREVPRERYAAEPLRKHVRVTTSGGQWMLDEARFTADSLSGYRDLNPEGEELLVRQPVALPLDQVQRLEQLRVDWYRTALMVAVGAGILAVVALSQKDEQTSSSGGRTPIP